MGENRASFDTRGSTRERERERENCFGLLVISPVAILAFSLSFIVSVCSSSSFSLRFLGPIAFGLPEQIDGEGRETFAFGHDFSAQRKVIKSPGGARARPVTIDFACFLSEIALFFFPFPLSSFPSPPALSPRSHPRRLPPLPIFVLALRVTLKIDTISRTSRSPGWSSSRSASF